MKKRIFVVVNVIAEVSVEREYYPVLCEDENIHYKKGIVRRGKLLHVSLFKEPCMCCGSGKHPLLERVPNEEGYTKAIFYCQMIKHQTVSQMISQIGISKKYAPCPLKFVKTYGYQEDVIEAALVALCTEGSGKDMTIIERKQFQTNVLRACFNKRMERSTLKIQKIGKLSISEYERYQNSA
jgi:hypothetical protein